MNMMLTNVRERTREIGLRKAIGAKKRDISNQFLVESIVVTIIGGIIGIALGLLVSAGVSSLGILQTKVTSGPVLLAFGVSAFIGIVFGYYPEKKASELNPIEALRYE
jgi:ABC-type antimicrobial peptide transport system permease subunit